MRMRMRIGSCLWVAALAIVVVGLWRVEGGEGAEGELQSEFMGWVQRVGQRVRQAQKLGKAGLVQPQEYSNSSLITVDKAGKGQYTSVQDAIDSLPSGNNQRVVIHIVSGVYEEKVRIPEDKSSITLEGDGAGSTIITWGDTAGSAGSLADSATVGVDSDYFIATGLTFKNSANAPEDYDDRQGVALRIAGDKAAFYDCNFVGDQDTLYDQIGRHYFSNCYIEGATDFICGDGQSLYKGCTLQGTSRSSFTAQRRSSPSDATGFSFVGCKITGSGSSFLGRAWGPYSRVVFSYTYMDDVVKPIGWYNWGSSSREKTVFYGEYKCSGPGANRDGRVSWSQELTDEQAAPFQSLDFIDGSSWIQE